MLKTGRAETLIGEAIETYKGATKHLAEAIAELDRTELVKAAEKSWAATLQATNAFIVAQSGVEPKPDDGPETSKHLLSLPEWQAEECDEELKELTEQYFSLTHILHDTVICERDIEPVSVLIQDIRDVAGYIEECERLALSGGE